MRMLKKLIFPAIIVLTLSSQAFSEEANIRSSLLEDESVTALYTIDEFNTLIKADKWNSLDQTLEAICSDYNGEIESNGNSLTCDGVFTASKTDSLAVEGQTVLITAEAAQPLAYRNPSIPSIGELAPLPGGRIEGDHTSIDIYQYMYALCKKEGGTPSVVVSKRFGKTARYTEVSAGEAFDYLLESGEGTDPWFFACEGEKRFIVEKDYQHSQDGSNKFTFHPKRGLEWVDYVKAGEGHVASLDAR